MPRTTDFETIDINLLETTTGGLAAQPKWASGAGNQTWPTAPVPGSTSGLDNGSSGGGGGGGGGGGW